MLVLDQENSYAFSNMTVKVTDNTVENNTNTSVVRSIPDFNILIPTIQEVGITNNLELFYPGEASAYIKAHGTPNCVRSKSFASDLIVAALSSGADVGVYTINLRGASATMANNAIVMKYKIEKDVPYKDAAGSQYYLSKTTWEITTTPTTGDIPVKRDVMHLKFELKNVANCKKWTDLFKGMSNMKSDTPDEQGYKVRPMLGVMYKGASTFGNNTYMSLSGKTAEYDGNMYYSATVYDGVDMVTTSTTMSLDIESGKKYNTSYFIENMFNDQFPTMRMMASEYIEEVYDVANPYLYTVDDWIASQKTGLPIIPSEYFGSVDPFYVNMFGCVVDEGSLDVEVLNSISLTGGNDGTETAETLYKDFFEGKIISDINSVLRYRISYIPDMDYNNDAKKALIDLVSARNRMTTATIMVGGNDTIESAIVDHQANYYNNMPNVRQLAKCQSPMMVNPFVNRTVTYPATYFDTISLLGHIAKWGNSYQPFAGALCRWDGYIDDTMVYPSATPEVMTALNSNRINVVMKDSEPGAYLTDQLMNTLLTSDQTELNNAFLISSMLYDLLQLVHRQHFKFNEAEEVRIFSEAVNDTVNSKYKAFSAVLNVEVYRQGTIGRAKAKNIIKVTVDLKDINKFTDVEIVLTEE